jgi:hypothetical protein
VISVLVLLDMAVEYGADGAKVAEDMMSIAERSDFAEALIAASEQYIGAWFGEQAPARARASLAAVASEPLTDLLGASPARELTP